MKRDKSVKAEEYYTAVLRLILSLDVPWMVGGAYALREYADIWRDTKDLDLFCKPGDYQRLLQVLADEGFETEISDANWLAKARAGDRFVDIIFNSANGLCPVDDSWFEYAPTVELFGSKLKLVPAEETLWTKLFVQQRDRFDGPDVLHILRACGNTLDWHRLLRRLDLHWEILLGHLLAFRFVYPSERDAVPRWVLEELLGRAREQFDLPAPQQRICRGPLLSRTDYEVDISHWNYEWGYKHRSSSG